MKRLVLTATVLALAIPGAVFLVVMAMGVGAGAVGRIIRDIWNDEA